MVEIGVVGAAFLDAAGVVGVDEDHVRLDAMLLEQHAEEVGLVLAIAETVFQHAVDRLGLQS